MSFATFITKGLIQQKNRRFSGPVIFIATTAIALGVAIMIVALAVGFGFQTEIRDKLVGFGSHITITNMDFNQSFETNPIQNDTCLVNNIRKIPAVQNVQPFILKPGIIKTSEAFQGIALKGIDAHFDTSFIASAINEGHFINLSDSIKTDGILLSKTLAEALKLQLNDPVRIYFVQNGIRARKFVLEGIFDTHFPEYDEKLAYVALRHLRQINLWNDDEISGYEVNLDSFDTLDEAFEDVSFLTSAFLGKDGTLLRAQSIRQQQPQMFGWLALMDTNMAVILVLIMAVAILNMISGLLILILENTNNIGLFKAMGATNRSIRRIFILISIRIIGKGMIIGNVVGLIICFLQSQYGFLELDPENYYLDKVPILLELHVWLLLNLGTIIVTTLALIGPSHVVAKIVPVKAIKFN